MPSPNPYQPNPVSNQRVSDAETIPVSSRRRVFSAWLLGCGCCFIGPAFLTLYYVSHDIGLGAWMIYLFGLAYLAPGLSAVAFGLIVGFAVSPWCPRISKTSRRWIITSVIVISYSIAISLLLSDHLNFGVDLPLASGLPAFSVVCALIAMVITAIDLAIRRPTVDRTGENGTGENGAN